MIVMIASSFVSWQFAFDMKPAFFFELPQTFLPSDKILRYLQIVTTIILLLLSVIEILIRLRLSFPFEFFPFFTLRYCSFFAIFIFWYHNNNNNNRTSFKRGELSLPLLFFPFVQLSYQQCFWWYWQWQRYLQQNRRHHLFIFFATSSVLHSRDWSSFCFVYSLSQWLHIFFSNSRLGRIVVTYVTTNDITHHAL